MLPPTQAYLDTIGWTGQAGYSSAPRKIWRPSAESGEIYGYYQQFENFTYAVIRGAGHIAPYDMPIPTLDLISRFVNNVPMGM